MAQGAKILYDGATSMGARTVHDGPHAPGLPALLRAGWSHAAVLALAGAWLLAVTWRRWPDVIVDFGRELYAPWRLVEGEVLYRDLAWFNGPLSVHWNALWFRLAGVGFGTLIAVNVALLAAFTALLHRTLQRLSSPLAALVGTLFFLFTFA